MNAVIYARFSSNAQTEASIEGQIKECAKYAAEHDYTIVDTYTDRAFSAKSDRRPSFQKMIADSENGSFQYVIVYQLDRFARNRLDSAVYTKALNDNGVKLVSAKENINDDSSGIIMQGILETFAEYFSAQLSEKVTRGMYLNASKCKYNGGIKTMGYVIDENKDYQVDPVTAPLIREIFERFANGENANEIAKDFNRRGIKTTQGKEFGKNSLQHILRNKKYIGCYTFGDFEMKDGIPRIVSDELFERVQNRLYYNRRPGGHMKAPEEYILSGKLYCGHCHEKMVGTSGTSGGNGKIYRYYYCRGFIDKSGCQKRPISKEYIEEKVAMDCYNMLTDENIEMIAKKIMEQTTGDKAQKEIKRMSRVIADRKKKIDNLMDHLADGALIEHIQAKIQKYDEEIRNLETEIEKEKKKLPLYTEEMIAKIFQDLKKGKLKSRKTMKAFINTLVDKIYLYDDEYTVFFYLGTKKEGVDKKYLLESEAGSDGKNGCVPIIPRVG